MSKTVAVIGASRHRHKFGNKALRAYRHRGYTVIPIHPTAVDVEGEKAYPTVQAYPGAIDEATVYVPPSVGIRVLDDIVAKGIATVWLNPGADDPAVVDRARALGLTAVTDCSIVGIGETPSAY